MLKVVLIVAAAMIVGSNGDGTSKVICAYDSSSFIREGKCLFCLCLYVRIRMLCVCAVFFWLKL